MVGTRGLNPAGNPGTVGTKGLKARHNPAQWQRLGINDARPALHPEGAAIPSGTIHLNKNGVVKMDMLPLQGAGRATHYLPQGVAVGLGYIGLSALRCYCRFALLTTNY
jgi:hypothetical protein